MLTCTEGQSALSSSCEQFIKLVDLKFLQIVYFLYYYLIFIKN